MQTITKDMTVMEIVNMDPYMSNILMGMGMHCISCVAASGESLEEALYVHGYAPEDVDGVVAQLNEFVASQAGAEQTA